MLDRLLKLFKKPAVASHAAGGIGMPGHYRMINGGWSGNRPYWGTHAGGMQKEVSVGEWRNIVSASQKLYWNFGPVAGAINDKSMFAVGRSWLPKFEGSDKEWGKVAEEWLRGQFYDVAFIDGNDFQTGLFMQSVAVDRDGDSACVYTETPEGYPQFQIIPWHAIGDRTGADVVQVGPYKGLRQYNGVIFNQYGRPVAYRILGQTPADDRDISARDMDFIREPLAVDQGRGLPAFTPAIIDLRDLTTVQGYVREAAKLAATIGLIEHNELGMADISNPAFALSDHAPASKFAMEELYGGTTRYFRAGAGAKLEQLKSEVPSEATDRLMERLIRNAMLGAGMPPEFYWDPSKIGGASVRMIISKVNRTVADRQDLLRGVARRRVGYAISKAIKRGILPEYRGADLGGSLKWGFTMPPILTADAGYAGQDAREAYKLGMRNLSDILGEAGQSLDEHLDQREREELAIRERMQRSNLPESAFRILTPNGNPQPTEPAQP
jgi:hypothetical protein